MNPITIDLNCDLGEVVGPEGRRLDAQLLQFVSSANIACGSHAGDKDTMRSTAVAARDLGVAIGAHPGFDDRKGMGRRHVSLTAKEISDLVRQQVESLAEIAQLEAIKLAHVKPHGALYHEAENSREVADAICEAVIGVDRSLHVFGASGGQLLSVAEAKGLQTVSEVFADRHYLPSGRLVARADAHAILSDPETVARRVLQMIIQHEVETQDGTQISVNAQTICIHSDHPQSLAVARLLRARLIEAGIRIVAP